MISNNLEELHAFAEKIGLKRCWFHTKNNRKHYDLVNRKGNPVYINGEKAVDKALACGAKIVRPREILRIEKLLTKTPLQKSLEFIAISNEMFKGSKPMGGTEYELLKEALRKSAKTKPTLFGRL